MIAAYAYAFGAGVTSILFVESRWATFLGLTVMWSLFALFNAIRANAGSDA